MPSGTSHLEALPAEIISYIFAFLPPASLASLSRTCRLLRNHAHNDFLWMSFLRNYIPHFGRLESSSPAKSWRELYIAHHPYWFLVQNKIWFADVPNNGLLILARYNHKNGRIEAFRLLAEHGAHTYMRWVHDPEVIIHTFNPRVRLWVDDPVINLVFNGGDLDTGNRLRKEVAMQTGTIHGICSMISLCRPIPRILQADSMALWPPAIIPARERVRNASATKFRTEEHRPQTLGVMSDQTFRVRKWLDFSNMLQPSTAVRMGEEVMTFSTLPEESYTPTKKKPWQGIWVGDYSGHGCEFLLVLQREVTSPMALSRTSSTDYLPRGMTTAKPNADTRLQDLDDAEGSKSTRNESPSSSDAQAPDSFAEAPLGRLEAIKLTGDINVPRGEYTWIAEDIGPNGLIRIANEQMFAGARIVRSWGHVADRGYQDDRFIQSQLIMISHDSLAQYWEHFGHISFYRRVNIDDHLTE
ncbi:F-box domain-containing protein [Usnea florida]